MNRGMLNKDTRRKQNFLALAQSLNRIYEPKVISGKKALLPKL